MARHHGILLGVILVLIIGVSAMISWQGEENVARELEEEPTISVFFHETGETREMKLEEYLTGVVAGEMFPDWPVEAYAAQAIFARSFTMAFIAEGGLQEERGADISTDIEEAQAYNAEAITPAIEQAVEMTRGEVLTYDGRYVKGWFHAYSGGQTATAKEGLALEDEEPPYVLSREFPENEFAPEEVKNWRAEYTQDELLAMLSQAGREFSEISDIRIAERGPTNRITAVEIEGDSGTQTISGPEFRLALDSTRMKSTLVSNFEFANGNLVIEGTGYGHGVGLSQWDAYKMAQEGQTPEDIATAFFKDVEIKKLYD